MSAGWRLGWEASGLLLPWNWWQIGGFGALEGTLNQLKEQRYNNNQHFGSSKDSLYKSVNFICSLFAAVGINCIDSNA